MSDLPVARLWPVWALAALLGGAAVLGVWLTEPGNQLPGILAWLAVVLLMELPAVPWRMRGGSPGTTLLVAIAGPLVPLEILLGFYAHKYRHVGGDLQGIEAALMKWVLPPVVLVTAALVAGLACLLIKPERD